MSDDKPAPPSSDVQTHILAALRDPARLAQLAPRELDFTVRVLRRARLLGNLASRLCDSGLLPALPPLARDALTGALAITEAQHRAARWELNRIAWALGSEQAAALVALKGCAYLLVGLPNAQGRLFADVDLLVPEASLGQVESQLAARGWRPAQLTPYDDNYYRLWTHELPPMRHIEREVEVDLHHNVLMRTARLRPDAHLLLESARSVPGSVFRVLAPIDMVLHAMAHLFYGGEMDDALRELVDIDAMLRHYGAADPGFWAEFWPRSVQLHLVRPAFYGLRYSVRLLDTPVPDEVLRATHSRAPPTPVVWLMDRLVPRALYPQHPDRYSRGTAIARLALYVRSHWVRMPALMLLRHLSYKFYVRHVRRTARGTAQAQTQ